MCGITGVIEWSRDRAGQAIEAMTATLTHRGPDDEGYLLASLETGDWVACGGRDTVKTLQLPSIKEYKDFPCGVALGHRRLAIVDLSPAGHGPMGYKGGRLWITYNGEVYNYLELREELRGKGYFFETNTDTEVILAAYNEWGIECVNHFNGMWAFALVDMEARKVFCSRDRAGVKPFYYWYDGKRFCFASEIKALLRMENVRVEPNDQVVADYLFKGVLDHTSETFFRGIHQLRPGEYLLFENSRLTIRSYWDIVEKEIRFDRDRNYTERFLELLQDSIRLRLRSDVPVGTCLSGGLDSSSIVCVANRLMFDGERIDPVVMGARQKTFSSCFEDPAYDEREFIELVAQQTGAERNYVFPQGERLFEDLSRLIWHQEEPFGSTSIYAQWQVMETAKTRGVTVLLDGQGGDELLAGYLPSFYFLWSDILKRWDILQWVREIKGVRRHHGRVFSRFLPGMTMALCPQSVSQRFKELPQKVAAWVSQDFRKKYLRHPLTVRRFTHQLDDYLYQLFRFSNLPGLLHYEDRNSMAFSIETRLPFLDYRLVEFLFSLPPEQKICEGVTKLILRKAMTGILPARVRDRSDKMGFFTPEDVWFRSLLRNEVAQVLSSKSFGERGYFRADPARDLFEKYCEGKIHIHSLIWRWVNLELWLRKFVDQKPFPEG